MARKHYYLGIDCGLTRIKTGIYSIDGNLIELCSSHTTLLTKDGGISEINMQNQWETTGRVIRSLFKNENVSAQEIECVGISGFGNGLFCLDKHGDPLNAAISSMDYRAKDIVNQFSRETKERLAQLTLQRIWAGQPGLILKWLKINDNETYQNISTVFFCKDWIRYCLTGEINTDYTDISGSGLFNNRDKKYDEEILSLLDIKEMRNSLSTALPAYEICGTVSKEASSSTGLLQGTPIVNGAFDVIANSIGSGLSQADQICSIVGTWNINIALSDTPIQPNHIRQTILYADQERYSLIDSSPTSATNLEWFLSKILQRPNKYELFNRSLENTSTRNEIIFMPFIGGSFGNENPGGSFHKLRSYHTDEDVLNAIAEGILFAHRYHIENIKNEGVKVSSVIITGGGSKSSNWCQMLADILQTEVKLPVSLETGILGDCLLAAYGNHTFHSIEQGIKKMVKIKTSFYPDPNKQEYYHRKYRLFNKYIDLEKNFSELQGD